MRVLVMGGNYHWQPRLRAISPSVESAMLCTVSALHWVHELERPHVVVGLDDGLPAEEWVRAASRLHHDWPIDVVASLNDIDQDKAQAVAAGLGLPFHSARTVVCARDKSAMREELAAAGVEDVPHRQLRSPEELRAFLVEVGPPLLVKPTAGRGGHGVTFVRSVDQVDAAFRRARDWNPKGMPDVPLAERFVDGEEFSVEAITHDGHHYIVAITEKFKDKSTLVEIGHLVPARIPGGVADAVVGHVRRVLTALGVHYGLTHTEVIVGANGPVTVETHLRKGGDEIEGLVRDATDINLPDLYLRQLLGEDIGRRPELRERAELPHYHASGAIRYLAPDLSGTLVGIHGWDEARARPGVVLTRQLKPTGIVLDGLRSSDDRLGCVRVTASDPHGAAALAESCVDLLRVECIRADRHDG
ncbi:MAG: ATP-grasp domain-containing protein [Pseudonocardia sp.]